MMAHRKGTHMLCAIHQKEMRTNSKGFYCATKVGEGWCTWKPGAPVPAGVASTAPSVRPVYERTPSDWERKVGKQKALCGMVNGLFAGGMKPVEITAEVMLKLTSILSNIETASGVPALMPDQLVPGTRSLAHPVVNEPPIEAYNPDEVNVDSIKF